MLITPSFFVGKIKIPNAEQKEVREELIYFIDDHEGEFLTKLLGEPLTAAFKAGLLIDPIPQIWVDLLAQIVTGGNSVLSETVSGYRYKDPEFIRFDETPGFTSGVASITVPAWKGWNVIIERQGFGTQFEPEDYTWNKEAGIWTKKPAGTFFQSENYFVQFRLKTATAAQFTTTANKSPIADYIYFKWLGEHASSVTGNGLTRAKTENSQNVSPDEKQVGIWNSMVDKNRAILKYLNSFVYFRGAYGPINCRELTTKINILGI